MVDIALRKPQRSKSLQLHRTPPPPPPPSRSKKSRPSSVQAKPTKKKGNDMKHSSSPPPPSASSQYQPSKKPMMVTEEISRQRPGIQRRRRSNSAQPNYAGPMFNNAPEPSSLPLPGFIRPRTTSFNDNWRRPSPQQQFPSKMVTSHDNVETDPILAEIQQRLRSVLKLGASQ
ncbi:hypothetical protein O0I10_003352 [Lichtheimia ornata]|uniref:Uncharacterized protein n=1 Tax=Lichtheimia ornata TaxID=688661 RepID=A0AAD7XXG4_9FUNG|nr:uncharacterized protein O0I10_003352 [Lichtheimia ornata]KAJ8660709.1 hypothetical protein O0I10_003352 [Lichtheimia ornata]